MSFPPCFVGPCNKSSLVDCWAALRRLKNLCYKVALDIQKMWCHWATSSRHNLDDGTLSLSFRGLLGGCDFSVYFLIGKNACSNGSLHKQVFISYKLLGGFIHLVIVRTRIKDMFLVAVLCASQQWCMGLDDSRVVTLDFDHGTLHWAFYKLASCSRYGSLQPIPNRHHTGLPRQTCSSMVVRSWE